MALEDKMINYIMQLRYEDLPSSVIDTTKMHILDTIGIIIAGSSSEGLPEMNKMTMDWGGRPEATILIYGGKVPTYVAGLVNGTMARARDFGDVHQSAGHLNETSVPAALNLAEYAKAYKKRTMSGKDYIVAVALCNDIIARIRTAGKEPTIHGGWGGETFAHIAVAAMGAKMFGFNEAKMRDAMANAYSQISGNLQVIGAVSLRTRLQQGLTVKGGILSVMLADIGFTGGPKDIFDDDLGLYHMYAHDELDPEVLVGKLGKRFYGAETCLKPWPSGRCCHQAIDGCLQLRKQHNIKPEEVEKVVLKISKRLLDAVGINDRLRATPRNPIDAQFSAIFNSAWALVKGGVSIEAHTPEGIKDPEVLAFSEKIEVIPDPERDCPDSILGTDTEVEITMKHGKRHKTSVQYAKGCPSNPMTWDECLEKYRDCVRFSAKSLDGNAEKIINIIERLEELDDVTGIIEHLTP